MAAWHNWFPRHNCVSEEAAVRKLYFRPSPKARTLLLWKSCRATKIFDAVVRRLGIDRRSYVAHNCLYVNPMAGCEVGTTTLLRLRGQKSGVVKRVATRAIRMAPKYIFVTGGVVSSLGKGVAASSIGCFP